MGVFSWIGSHWFSLIQTLGIIGALLLGGAALFLDVRVRRVGNLIQLTEHHRNLWDRLIADPQFARILDPGADLTKRPPTPAEEMFVIFIILHLSSTYFAMTTGFYQRPEGLSKDVQRFLSLPLPWHVWNKVKDLQERAFLEFVESCLSDRNEFRI